MLSAERFLGSKDSQEVPDLVWEKDHIKTDNSILRVLSLTELPQTTWQGCFQTLFEAEHEFILSFHIELPAKHKTRKHFDTKRRVNHALSISSSVELKNIESNSALSSSEEILERILVGKETLFKISVAIILNGDKEETSETAQKLIRIVSSVGNAGLFLEKIGSLPVFRSHLPCSPVLAIRELPILSDNLSHILPIFHDYSRINDHSQLELRSRTGEKSNLNLFSKENLNFNAFICGSSGSGKSFLMSAIIDSLLRESKDTRISIFDIGGSYDKIVRSLGGRAISFNYKETISLISTFLKLYPVKVGGFFNNFITILCGTGKHITHSHHVAINDILKEMEGSRLIISDFIKHANSHNESFYKDIAHWLGPFKEFDDVEERKDLKELLKSNISSFDFREINNNPIIQKVTILLLSELIWRDLKIGKFSKNLIIFDEVWKFFAQNKEFLEEMYRTLRKYKAGIVSITQNLADYGDEAFSKMIFTNSGTKIFLQNGASGEFLKNTFDLNKTDIARALSVSSQKPHYSEFFALTPDISQIFRLYPRSGFYKLANTENITKGKKGEI